MHKIIYNNSLKLKSRSDEFFSGYASVYHEVDSHYDIVLPGAFKECLKKPESVKLLWQHDASTPIGVFTKMRETSNGIYVEGRIISQIAKGNEILELIRAGAVDGLSIGFEILDCYYKANNRYITKGRLWEISIVTFPANNKARINNVKNKEIKGLINDLDKAICLIDLIQNNLSNKKAGGRY